MNKIENEEIWSLPGLRAQIGKRKMKKTEIDNEKMIKGEMEPKSAETNLSVMGSRLIP